jgi:hypothetical protein
MDFNQSFSDDGAGSEREFSIALQKCDSARHSKDAVTPKVYSPVKNRPQTALETPEKLNLNMCQPEESDFESFSPTKAQQQMDPDELSPVKQPKGGEKRWAQFQSIETYNPLDTSLTVEQQKTIEELKKRRQVVQRDAQSFSDAVDDSVNIESKKKEIIDRLTHLQL